MKAPAYYWKLKLIYSSERTLKCRSRGYKKVVKPRWRTSANLKKLRHQSCILTITFD